MTLLDVKNQIEGTPEFDHGDSWPEPDLTILVAGRRKPPELPLEVFGDFWGQWISGHAESMFLLNISPLRYYSGPYFWIYRQPLSALENFPRSMEFNELLAFFH